MTRTDDRLVQEAFAVARTAYNQPELRAALAEYRKSLLLCEEMCRKQDSEIERLRSALQVAEELAEGDAPAHMIIDVCASALAPVSHD